MAKLSAAPKSPPACAGPVQGQVFSKIIGNLNPKGYDAKGNNTEQRVSLVIKDMNLL